jgi:hypothetical protein
MITTDNSQSNMRGAVFVTTAISMVVLVLFAGLAIEAFRMLASRLQLENAAEYAAEVEINEIVNGVPPYSFDPSRLSPMLNLNSFLGQEGSGQYDADISTGITCTTGACVAIGCYDSETEVFTEGSTTCNGLQLWQASVVTVRTLANRKFGMMFAQMLGYASIDISVRAISYSYDPDLKRTNAGAIISDGPLLPYFVTGPFRQ